MPMRVLRVAPIPLREPRISALEAALGSDVEITPVRPCTTAELERLVARDRPDAVVVDAAPEVDPEALAAAGTQVLRPSFGRRRNTRREVEAHFIGYQLVS